MRLISNPPKTAKRPSLNVHPSPQKRASHIRARQTLSLVNAARWRVLIARNASRLSDLQVKAMLIESDSGAARY
jgi:hypothetical protein